MTQPYVGEIRLFPYSFAPNGWFDCDGSLKPISEYDVLYALLGTTYGGDGQTTFAVPDMRGRVPIHMGQGLGLSQYVLGQMSGTEEVTLLGSNLPTHDHSLLVTSAGANSNTPSNSVELGTITGDTLYSNNVAGVNPAPLAAASLSLSGGNSPHENTMPTLTVRFCIAWAGVFPSQG
ncbi:tail fiber protein [Dyella sp. GSA-30]|uniref:phage tail protein n=1 Tax=Dyella sp. GSA-30 TaxID=2994496 RepID=UPI00248F5BB9|nr:tail fiber protein [Dyella sp. GSA-30]BDU19169.1 microcystin dependent protein [Dyella sp. GSA-30]